VLKFRCDTPNSPGDIDRVWTSQRNPAVLWEETGIPGENPRLSAERQSRSQSMPVRGLCSGMTLHGEIEFSLSKMR
jgi:hypothetical protein